MSKVIEVQNPCNGMSPVGEKVIAVDPLYHPLYEQNGITPICITFSTRIDAGGGCMEHLTITKYVPTEKLKDYQALVGQYVKIDIPDL